MILHNDYIYNFVITMNILLGLPCTFNQQIHQTMKIINKLNVNTNWFLDYEKKVKI